MNKSKINHFKNVVIYIMSVSYVLVGVAHFINPDFFLNIMPDYLPWHLELVYISGAIEILLGVLLIFKKTRKLAGWGLIALLIAVFPANIYLVQSEEAQQALEISREMSIVRLPFQLLFIAIAFWFTRD